MQMVLLPIILTSMQASASQQNQAKTLKAKQIRLSVCLIAS